MYYYIIIYLYRKYLYMYYFTYKRKYIVTEISQIQRFWCFSLQKHAHRACARKDKFHKKQRGQAQTNFFIPLPSQSPHERKGVGWVF